MADGVREPGGPTVSAHEALRAAGLQLHEAIEADNADEVAWAQAIGAAAEAMVEALEEHRGAAEAPDGTLAEVVQVKPALARRVELQTTDHGRLLERAEHLRLEAREQSFGAIVDVEVLRLEASVLHDAVRLHIAWGADLLYEAFFRDEGGEG